MDEKDLKMVMDERDLMRDRIRDLTETPLRFSLSDLSSKVRGFLKGFTPDQLKNVEDLIENGGRELLGKPHV